ALAEDPLQCRRDRQGRKGVPANLPGGDATSDGCPGDRPDVDLVRHRAKPAVMHCVRIRVLRARRDRGADHRVDMSPIAPPAGCGDVMRRCYEVGFRVPFGGAGGGSTASPRSICCISCSSCADGFERRSASYIRRSSSPMANSVSVPRRTILSLTIVSFCLVSSSETDISDRPTLKTQAAAEGYQRPPQA